MTEREALERLANEGYELIRDNTADNLDIGDEISAYYVEDEEGPEVAIQYEHAPSDPDAFNAVEEGMKPVAEIRRTTTGGRLAETRYLAYTREWGETFGYPEGPWH